MSVEEETDKKIPRERKEVGGVRRRRWRGEGSHLRSANWAIGRRKARDLQRDEDGKGDLEMK